MSNTSVAVMQPYLFPYLGYFQLIKASDIFIYYDDVNFIKQGWVNRNRVLLQGKESYFTVPLKSVSSFVPINETAINYNLYSKWRNKFIKSLEQSYKNAPFQSDVIQLIIDVIDYEYPSIGDLAMASINETCKYLNIQKIVKKSSSDFNETKGMDRTERLITIVKSNNGTTYINPSGGNELYHKEDFRKHGIELKFISNQLAEYQHGTFGFIKGLSIIDVMMWNGRDAVSEMLLQYTLN